MSHDTVRESKIGVAASWLSLAASFVLSFATWVSLGKLAGFGELSWAMPLCVDGYVVTALMTWMAPVSDDVARFARVNTYAAAAAGVAAQSAFHAFTIWTGTHEVWKAVLAASVGMLPPLIAALAVHMRALVRRATPVKAATPRQAVDQAPAAVAPAVAVAPVAATPTPVAVPALTVVSRDKKPATSWDKDKARQLLAEGRSAADVAVVVGTSKRTIERLRDKTDLEAVS